MSEQRLTRVTQLLVILETISLATLLVNLATTRNSALAAAVGPVHGMIYLSVIIATLLNTAADRPAKMLSVLPAVGGLLALRRLQRHPARP